MSQSTPLNQLPPPTDDIDPEQDTDMVMNIMNEIRRTEEISKPPKRSPTNTYPMNPNTYRDPKPANSMLLNTNPMLYEDDDEEEDEPVRKPIKKRIPKKKAPVKCGIIERIKNEVKEPAIVGILAVLASTPFIMDLLYKYIPYMINVNTGQPTMISYAIKALIIGFVFWVAKRFLIPL